MTYTIKQGRIAAVQYIETPAGEHLTAVYLGEENQPEITHTGDARDIRESLPLPVQAAINRQFGIVFALPYASREAFVLSSQPFTVEA